MATTIATQKVFGASGSACMALPEADVCHNSSDELIRQLTELMEKTRAMSAELASKSAPFAVSAPLCAAEESRNPLDGRGPMFSDAGRLIDAISGEIGYAMQTIGRINN